MKHALRNLFITICYHGGIVWLYQRWQRRRGPLVRVVCFHDVPDRAWFASVLHLFATRYHILSPDDFIHERFVPDRINLLLTFDDGYQSWQDVALPELAELNATAIFFLSSGLLSAAEGEDAGQAFARERLRLTTTRKLLTWSAACALRAAGHTLGGHTVNHLSLARLAEGEMRTEIRHDRSLIEAECKLHLTHFAYPFGTPADFSSQVQQVASAAGYRYTYTAVPGFCEPKTTASIPRLLIEANQPIARIQEWIEGGYDIFYKLKQR